jgi:pimeloyl-ACP methyl ester carboxylesterase
MRRNFALYRVHRDQQFPATQQAAGARHDVALTGPASSGSADTPRHCQGCSHPRRGLPDRAAVRAPTHIIHGGGDPLMPVAAAHHLAGQSLTLR